MKNIFTKLFLSLFVYISHTTGLCFVSHSPQVLETRNWQLETDGGSPLWKGGGGNAAGGLSLSYDALGKVAQTFLSVYKYDALGNRVVMDDKYFIPNHSDSLKRPVIECNELGEIIRYYIWGDNRLLGFIEGNTLTVAHCDDFGSVIALTDLSGNLLYSANYGPHGEDWGSTGFNPTPFAWLGGYGVQTLETDTPLRLYLTRHRVYSATLNRFLSADPIGLAGGGNLYAYGEGNPMAYIDPFGLCSQSSGWGYAWAMAGAIVSGFTEGWKAGWEINFNTLSLGLTDSLGWTDSGRHEGTMYDVSRGLAAVGTLALAQAGALAVTEVAGTALVNWGAGAAGAAGGAAVAAQRASQSVPTTPLFHGGNLQGGIVQAAQFSTTTDFAYAQQYATRAGGQVYTFNVPTAMLRQMEVEGTVRTLSDAYMNATHFALEYRFDALVSPLLNPFLKK